ncbi:MAG: hypothetical protein HZB19_18035 [Chloroflexi bacterium]|nr:hypothetical protein [Chloroflexota bacterium]
MTNMSYRKAKISRSVKLDSFESASHSVWDGKFELRDEDISDRDIEWLFSSKIGESILEDAARVETLVSLRQER